MSNLATAAHLQRAVSQFPASWYTDPRVFELEQRLLLPRGPGYVGHELMVPEAGDYINFEIGRESILCVRGSDGRIRAFYNVCQHRGNQLVTAEWGSLAGGEFQCAYHGWRFSDTGALNWVYCEDDFPQGDPCGKRNLAEIPCDTWGGFIWINMDPGCVSLQEYLSPVAEQLHQAGVNGSIEFGDAAETPSDELVPGTAYERPHLGMAGGVIGAPDVDETWLARGGGPVELVFGGRNAGRIPSAKNQQ